MVEVIALGVETVLDVAQAGLPARLGVEQGGELVPGLELLNITVRSQLPDTRIEMMSRDEIQQLLENRVIMSQGSPPSSELGLDNPILLNAEDSFIFPRTDVSALKVESKKQRRSNDYFQNARRLNRGAARPAGRTHFPYQPEDSAASAARCLFRTTRL